MRYITVLFLFIHTLASGQSSSDAKRDYTWVFGDPLFHTDFNGSGINFNSSPINVFPFPHELKIATSSGCISDMNGQLLFFTDGMRVADCVGEIMPHGDSLCFNLGYLYADKLKLSFIPPQGVLILPKPLDDLRYYIIQIEADTSNSIIQIICPNVSLHIVDMSMNLGKGDVISKNSILIDDTVGFGTISAVRHGNGLDWWVLIPDDKLPIINSILITAEGVQSVNKQIIGAENLNGWGSAGSSFSPTGNKYALYRQYPVAGSHNIGLFNFNRCTGLLDSCIDFSFSDSAFGLGLAFSANSRYLYFTTDKYIYQFDVLSSNVAGSRQIVGTYDGYWVPGHPIPAFGNPMLGPDNKIYITGTHSEYFHVINNPDSPGLNCNFSQRAFQLPYRNLANSIPNNPNYRLGPLYGSECYTGVDNQEPSLPPIIQVYPNPAVDHLTVDIGASTQNEPIQLLVFNSLAEKMETTQAGRFQAIVTLDVSSYPPGMYYGMLKNSKGINVGNFSFGVMR
jgi:hypothetical protein